LQRFKALEFPKLASIECGDADASRPLQGLQSIRILRFALLNQPQPLLAF
jgi:hypothetical protein